MLLNNRSILENDNVYEFSIKPLHFDINNFVW